MAKFTWQCQADGECCRVAGPVVMTLAESALLREAAPNVALRFDGMGDGRRVVLQPVPGTQRCPLLGEDGRCTVYEARPYNCRRFACLRHDKAAEPLVLGGPLGCVNAEAKVRTNAAAAVFLDRYQRPARRWAVRHGWTRDMQ